jgi:hypothetical protein
LGKLCGLTQGCFRWLRSGGGIATFLSMETAIVCGRLLMKLRPEIHRIHKGSTAFNSARISPSETTNLKLFFRIRRFNSLEDLWGSGEPAATISTTIRAARNLAHAEVLGKTATTTWEGGGAQLMLRQMLCPQKVHRQPNRATFSWLTWRTSHQAD